MARGRDKGRSRARPKPLFKNTAYAKAKARGDTRGMHDAQVAAQADVLKDLLRLVPRGRKKRLKERLGLE